MITNQIKSNSLLHYQNIGIEYSDMAKHILNYINDIQLHVHIYKHDKSNNSLNEQTEY